MFRLQRKYLVQKIWSARDIGDQVSSKAFGFLKEAVHNFLASLDLISLRRLAKVVSEKQIHSCLYLTDDIRGCVHERQRHLICRVWRWSDLKENVELKHIIESSSEEEGEMADCLCVNPFHFSRITKRVAEIPYQNLPRSKESTQEDSGLSCGTTDERWKEKVCQDLTIQDRRKRPWLTLAYWEQDKRIGNMYHGCDTSINIYESKSKGHREGLCLQELHRTCEMNNTTKLVFKHIGEGVQVSLEDGDIWIYNKSMSPVFLNGELLQRLHDTDTPRVDKLPSGYGLKVFDSKSSQTLDKRRDEEEHCLRVSFVKGFGTGYKRQTIMNCPCWIEMFFTLPKS